MFAHNCITQYHLNNSLSTILGRAVSIYMHEINNVCTGMHKVSQLCQPATYLSQLHILQMSLDSVLIVCIVPISCMRVMM